MKRQYFILLTICLSFCSCQSIMKTVLFKVYRIKNPEVETEQSILREALRYKIDTTNIVCIDSKDYLPSYPTIASQGFPGAIIYNSEGKQIEYKDSLTSCKAGLFNFIPELKLENKYTTTDSLPLASEYRKFRDLKGNNLAELEEADFYLLIYWTVFIGKLNKDHVKAWENLAKENKNCKIKVIKVNTDFQSHWDEAECKEIVDEFYRWARESMEKYEKEKKRKKEEKKEKVAA